VSNLTTSLGRESNSHYHAALTKVVKQKQMQHPMFPQGKLAIDHDISTGLVHAVWGRP
jgi:hypothetical protein